jgi:hypothetical protein
MSVLALLQPWRDLHELKGGSRSWKEEGLAFMETASKKEHDIIAGMQYYYDSKIGAQRRNEDLMEMDEDLSDDKNIIDVDERENDDEIDCKVRCF